MHPVNNESSIHANRRIYFVSKFSPSILFYVVNSDTFPVSKRSRHPLGFYASLLSDDRDRGFCCLKYRSKVKPAVMGVYEVERIVAKKTQGRQAEYFIQ